MRSRTDSRSRWMWWCANISARDTTSLNASSISCSAICGSGRTDLRSPSSALAGQVSRSRRGSGRCLSAAVLKRSYSCRRRTSSARGSLLVAGVRIDGARQQHARLDLGERRGHHQVLAGELELQLLHQLDVLHVLRVISAIGMSRMSRFCRRIRYSSRSSGPSNASRNTSSACGGM